MADNKTEQAIEQSEIQNSAYEIEAVLEQDLAGLEVVNASATLDASAVAQTTGLDLAFTPRSEKDVVAHEQVHQALSSASATMNSGVQTQASPGVPANHNTQAQQAVTLDEEVVREETAVATDRREYEIERAEQDEAEAIEAQREAEHQEQQREQAERERQEQEAAERERQEQEAREREEQERQEQEQSDKDSPDGTYYDGLD